VETSLALVALLVVSVLAIGVAALVLLARLVRPPAAPRLGER
jgi:hypothetical protein